MRKNTKTTTLKIITLALFFSFFCLSLSVQASTSFPKPFPLTDLQKSSPEFSPYGINVYHNKAQEDLMSDDKKDKVYRLLSEAGIKWIRLQVISFYWGEIQPQRDVWNWEKIDKEIQMIGNYGMEIQGTIINPCPPDEPLPLRLWCRNANPPWWDGNDQDFISFLNKLFERYSSPVGGKRKITYWMSFNEWNGSENGVPSDYFVRYMRIISHVLKAKSPELKLSAPLAGNALIQEVSGDSGKINEAFSPPNSAGAYHDFLAFHKYASYRQMNDRNIPFIQSLEAITHIKFAHPEYNISDRPVWVTEGGYGCNLTPGTSCTPEGESLQADDLQKRYWIALHPSDYGIDNRLRIDKVFWFKDTSSNTGWPGDDTVPEWGTCGLFNLGNNYEPRPAYYAYKEMALWYKPSGAVQLDFPTNDSRLNVNSPAFKWKAPSNFGSEGFKRYVIQIDNDQYFTSPLILEKSNPWGFGYSTSTRYPSTVDIPAGEYYWRVKVEDQKGNFSSWSPAWKFTINPLPVPDTIFVNEPFNRLRQQLWRVECDERNDACSYGTKFLTENNNSFIRFTWKPWDVRIPKEIEKNKGGVEIAERWAQEGSLYNGEKTEGWDDNEGYRYPSIDYTIWYSWRFRLVDLSALDNQLVKSAFIGQFHVRDSLGLGASPVIGVFLKTEDNPSGNDLINLLLKIPCESGTPGCQTEGCDGLWCNTISVSGQKIPKSSRNSWHDIQLKIHWSADPQQGHVIGYLDGKKIWDKTATNLPNGHPNFIKLGLYTLGFNKNLEAGENKLVIDYDEYKVSNFQSFSLPGDIDPAGGDGDVDIFDFSQMLTDFGKTGTAGFTPADIDKSGKVDIFDYNILLTNYGKSQQ